jgi:hypothetical protein
MKRVSQARAGIIRDENHKTAGSGDSQKSMGSTLHCHPRAGLEHFSSALPDDEASKTGRNQHRIRQRIHGSQSNEPAFSQCEAVALEGLQVMMSDEKLLVRLRKIVGHVHDRGLKGEKSHLVPRFVKQSLARLAAKKVLKASRSSYSLTADGLVFARNPRSIAAGS